MKGKDIKVGRKYLIRRSTRFAVVEVKGVREVRSFRVGSKPNAMRNVWDCIDLLNNKPLIVTSAVKFRREANNMDVERLCKKKPKLEAFVPAGATEAPRRVVDDRKDIEAVERESQAGINNTPYPGTEPKGWDCPACNNPNDESQDRCANCQRRRPTNGIEATVKDKVDLIPLNKLTNRITSVPLEQMWAVFKWCRENEESLVAVAPHPTAKSHYVVRAAKGAEELWDRLVKVGPLGDVRQVECRRLFI